MASKTLRIALAQINVGKDLNQNLQKASEYISKAKDLGAKLVALPECFNCPYGTNFFKQYSETIPDGLTCNKLSQLAKLNNIYIVGGTIPEVEESKIYNTCTVWNPNGDMIAKYRKMHLFDIDIPQKITFKESDVLSPGNKLCTFDINGIKIGLGICYDLRFEELAKLYRMQGCKAIIYPGAFNMTTGPMHWELLQRARATDNQIYVMSVSPARGNEGYIAWAHSQVTDPWGKVIGCLDEKEDILLCDLNFEECDIVREQIPIFHQRRLDIYNTIIK